VGLEGSQTVTDPVINGHFRCSNKTSISFTI